ncbi:hypothetical protein FRC07_004255 [Ceratobasidium sp. 392]|nr:hypothetical protein FRC07_004255 [Ceratobasidium sp. 392]
MPSVLDQLAAALQHRREQQEAAERAMSPAWPGFSENGDSDAAIPPIPDSLIDPALPRSEPTNTRRRREVTELNEDSPTERKVKYARITEDTCNAYALCARKRLEVQDFSSACGSYFPLQLDLNSKLIVLFAHMQGISRDLGMRDAKNFALTTDGKEQTQSMLNCVILAPTNKCYVTGASIKRFLKGDVSLHWDTWRVAQSTTQDPDAMKELVGQFLSSLTAIRNGIKDTCRIQQLIQAHNENRCINWLMNELVPDSMYVTDKHRARWAWIFAYYQEHREGGKKDHQFWHNLDKHLGELEEALTRQEPDMTARAALREIIFESALEMYRDRRSTQVIAREAPYDAPSWQLTLEARLARNLGFSASD